MSTPSYSCSVREVELDEDQLEPNKVVSGSPVVSSRVLSTSYNGNVVRGIWKCTEGVVTDVEEDEFFTVVEGQATVIVEGGATMELYPGVAGEFRRGDKTTWHIREPILKTFQITLYDDEDS
mmetsp:Transcript_16733/g.25128  ORF Transcript_16733/g.25128 Transcript_16733/m.25128 type:complete len:122 (-) Transcript_16733:192-557(-)